MISKQLAEDGKVFSYEVYEELNKLLTD